MLGHRPVWKIWLWRTKWNYQDFSIPHLGWQNINLDIFFSHLDSQDRSLAKYHKYHFTVAENLWTARRGIWLMIIFSISKLTSDALVWLCPLPFQLQYNWIFSFKTHPLFPFSFTFIILHHGWREFTKITFLNALKWLFSLPFTFTIVEENFQKSPSQML